MMAQRIYQTGILMEKTVLNGAITTIPNIGLAPGEMGDKKVFLQGISVTFNKSALIISNLLCQL